MPRRTENTSRDERYFELLAGALRVCSRYKPMFGKGRKGGMALEQFQQMYQSDPFYAWVGLDSPLMYAAHKAAGGMTSIYRQLGIGCQWVFSAVLQDNLGLSAAEANWTYQVPTLGNKLRSLSLDGKIEMTHIRDEQARRRVTRWLEEAAEKLLLTPEVRKQLKGVVFEVRQGIKVRTRNARMRTSRMRQTLTLTFTRQFCCCSRRRLMRGWRSVIRKRSGCFSQARRAAVRPAAHTSSAETF